MVFIRKSRDVYTKEKATKGYDTPNKMIPNNCANVLKLNNVMPWGG